MKTIRYSRDDWGESFSALGPVAGLIAWLMEDIVRNMNSQSVGLRVASVIFALVCAAHLLRVITRVDIMIAGRQLPVWLNIVGIVVAGALSLWMWRLSKS
jgi:hypothetical protein